MKFSKFKCAFCEIGQMHLLQILFSQCYPIFLYKEACVK